jgi:hypothetical protein
MRALVRHGTILFNKQRLMLIDLVPKQFIMQETLLEYLMVVKRISSQRQVRPLIIGMNWDGEKIWINGWFSCTNT